MPPSRTLLAVAAAAVLVAVITGVVWFPGPRHKGLAAVVVALLLGCLGWVVYILPAYWD